MEFVCEVKLVRENFQRRMSGSSGVDTSTFGVSPRNLILKLEQGIPGFLVGKGGQIRTMESRKGGGRPRDAMSCSEVKKMRYIDSSGLMWVDNYCILSDDMDKLTWMVNDFIEELMDLDMEPKAE